MRYSIIGSGSVGMALATQFARQHITVGLANSRGPDSLASLPVALAEHVIPQTLTDALQAQLILLAVPFRAHRDVAAALGDWQGKIVIDATNAYGIPLSELGGQPSSAVVARAMPGATLVKAFNHLPAAQLAQEPASAGGRRAIFLAGDDDAAVETVAALVQRLGYAPVSLGKLAEGGLLVQAREQQWAPLIFQDLFKKDS
ncbi:NADPH-dependent F420 reductase [Serratia sp. AKBS12]|uniref:NADPH-dependent F420 reductase n=1 Tax=Serratia sp. AKBS12 TaxID=2974597 RepID=UPI0021656CB5|nr:NAD(P)-binding domain-containing protein [Serratia sp. AKBS12]MCS3407970.1 NAD(P)-binding domain-containing protein [Serratia sp. AKBS12]HEI8866336.1 NAD(P)-binding domain-containing protein [Serratia odorifera]